MKDMIILGSETNSLPIYYFYIWFQTSKQVMKKFQFIFSHQAVKTDNKLLFENKGKFLLVHSSSGYKHALKEVLQDPAVLARLVDTKETYQSEILLMFISCV